MLFQFTSYPKNMHSPLKVTNRLIIYVSGFNFAKIFFVFVLMALNFQNLFILCNIYFADIELGVRRYPSTLPKSTLMIYA